MPNPLQASQVNRSQYLADALTALQEQGQQTRTPGALGANLLASYLLNRQRNRAEDRERQLAEEADNPRREALANLMRSFGGGQAATPGQPTPVAMNAEGGGIAPMAPQGTGGGVPSLGDPALQRALIAAQMAGVDGVGGMVDVLEAGQPQIAIGDNGMAYDARDRSNVGRSFAGSEYVNNYRVTPDDPNAPAFLPTAPDGGAPVFDEGGGVARFDPIPGYADVLGTTTRAEEDARNASRASYAGVTAEAEAAGAGRGGAPYETVTVQDSEGRPVTLSLQALLDGGGIVGQSTEEEAAAGVSGTTTAEREAEIFRRAEAAPSAIRRYSGALELLPDAITGFGADITLQAARVAAAAGNEDAQRRVAATELYQTLINRDLGILIREIAGSTQISNTDREFAARVSGGDIQMNPETLTRMLQIYIEDQNRNITRAEEIRSRRGAQSGQPRVRRWNPVTQDFD